MKSTRSGESTLHQNLARASALGILLLAFGLRVWQLDVQSLWHDEGLSWWFARQPLTQLLTHVAGTEHPPLYFLALGWWIRVAGDSVYALRFLSVIGGTVTVALLIRLAQRWRMASVGLLAALFLAWNPFHIWYSQEVRSYAWLPFVALLLAWEGERWTRTRRRSAGIRYGILTGFALYVHPFLGFLLLAHAVYFLLRRWRATFSWREAVRALWPFGITALFFLPWVVPTVGQLHTNRTYFYWGYLNLTHTVQNTAQALAYFSLPEAIRPTYLPRVTFLLWGLAVIGSVIGLRRRWGWWVVLGTWFPLALTLGIAYMWPKYAPRYVIYVLPFWLLLVATALLAPVHLVRGTKDDVVACMAGTFLALFIIGYGVTSWQVRELTNRPEAARPDFRGPITFLHEKAQPGDVLFLVGGHMEHVVRYYLRRDDVMLRPLPQGLLLDLGNPLRWGPVAEAFNEVTRNHSRVWGVFWQEDLADPQRLVYSVLNLYGCALLPTGLTERVDVGLYLIPRPLALPPTPTSTYPIGVPFRNGLVLEGFHAARLFSPHTAPDVCFRDRQQPHPTVQVAAGETLYVVLLFRPRRPLTGDLMGFVHLVNTAGNKAFALDDRLLGDFVYPVWRWQVGETVQQTFALSLPRDLPPGDYALEMGLYHPQTLQRVDPLPRSLPSGRVDGSRILYGPVRVLSP